jgi:hypothetical protein
VNRSVPTLLGIVIILLVVVLVVLVYNMRMTQAIGRGERVVGTVGGELLTGEEAPEEFIEETSALGREPDRPEPRPSPTMREGSRAREGRRAGEERRAQRRSAGEGEAPPGSP